jgi:hypothetical protein
MQYVDLEDFYWLQNLHKQINSGVISVFNFTLIGSAVQVCDPEIFNGPFITYLREDDTYTSLVSRLSVITGDKNLLNNCKLAVVHDGNRPHFIPKPSSITSAVASHEQSSTATLPQPMEQDNSNINLPPPPPTKPTETIWEIFTKHYPLLSTPFYKRNSKNDRVLPYLGIQRSSAEVQALTSAGEQK